MFREKKKQDEILLFTLKINSRNDTTPVKSIVIKIE